MKVISSLKKRQYTRERYQNLTGEENNKKREYVVNSIKISQKMKNKSQLSIKITKRSLNKVSVSRYKSKNGLVLEQTRLWFLAISVGEIGATKYIEFLYQAIQ